MKKEPSEQSGRIFGHTKCADILFDKIKDDRKLLRSCACLYSQARAALAILAGMESKASRYARRAILGYVETEIAKRPWPDEIKHRVMACVKVRRHFIFGKHSPSTPLVISDWAPPAGWGR